MTKHQKHAGFESTLAPTVSGIVMVSLIFHRFLRCVSLADPACAGSQAAVFPAAGHAIGLGFSSRITRLRLSLVTMDGTTFGIHYREARRCGDVVEQKLNWLLKPMHEVENKPKVSQTLTSRS
jgi:hypothetical protein